MALSDVSVHISKQPSKVKKLKRQRTRSLIHGPDSGSADRPAHSWGDRSRRHSVVASWIDHLRQHERVTSADRLQEEVVFRFNLAGEPNVTHFIAAEP